MPSHTQNWNRHRANDCVAVDPQVSAIGVALCNQQICLCLLRKLAQHLRHVTTADEHVRLDAHVSLKLREMLGGIADKRFFELRIDESAAWPPDFYRGSDVRERKTGAEFGSHLRSPGHSFLTTRPKIDRAQHVMDRKLMDGRFFHMGTRPYRAFGPV